MSETIVLLEKVVKLLLLEEVNVHMKAAKIFWYNDCSLITAARFKSDNIAFAYLYYSSTQLLRKECRMHYKRFTL